MPTTFIVSKKPEFDKVIDHLRQDLSSLRTGRANAAILDNVKVEAYGAMMDLKGVGSISVPDAKTIVIDPWDKGLLHAIEQAIQKSDVGINPVNDGKILRLTMPQMTEESRKVLVKVMKEKAEDARVAMRQVREKVREEILQQEKDHVIAEDERFKLQDDLEKFVKDMNGEVDVIVGKKEEEIMTV
ncbi:MAG: ribosome recycling factor [Patescibacteria group bacterium]